MKKVRLGVVRLGFVTYVGPHFPDFAPQGWEMFVRLG